MAHLQNNLHVIRVPFALLVAPELWAAVQQRSDNTGLLGVYRWWGDKRGRGCEGRGRGVTEVSSGNRHGSRFAGSTPTAGNSRQGAGLCRRLRWSGKWQKWSTNIQRPLLLHGLVNRATSSQNSSIGVRRQNAVGSRISLSHWSTEFTVLRISTFIGYTCGSLEENVWV